jgi:RecJ-like exonuclease
LEGTVHIYTHIDTDGISSGAILGKALYREEISFQITVLRQLEREEIIQIKKNDQNNFLIFSDFGSGQYLELQDKLINNNHRIHLLILDHHFPQNIANKLDFNSIKDVYQKTKLWHLNPYFYGIDGSIEISGAGMSYFFAKCLNENNIDLSPVAIIGAIGDVQNQGPNKSFLGLNSLILEDAKGNGYVEIIDDLNFSSIKPLNQAIAYSPEITLPGLSKDVNKTLKFLQTLGILMEDNEGNIRTLYDLNNDEKQKLSSGIIEFATMRLDIEPNEIIEKLIVNRYLIKKEINFTKRYDSSEFSNVLNACGRTNNASLGIALAMGDRKNAYKQSQELLKKYKTMLRQSMVWLREHDKIQHKEFIQYFYGEEQIPENIIGTIASMLVFSKSDVIDLEKPIFGIATREDEDVYKISGRAHEQIVEKGVNLSEAIREALKLSDLDALGGGHPPAAGTKVPVERIDIFLDNCNKVIKKQLK